MIKKRVGGNCEVAVFQVNGELEIVENVIFPFSRYTLTPRKW